MFGFWASKSLKLRRNACFFGFKSSLVENFHELNLKCWPSQKCEIQSFFPQKVPI